MTLSIIIRILLLPRLTYIYQTSTTSHKPFPSLLCIFMVIISLAIPIPIQNDKLSCILQCIYDTKVSDSKSPKIANKNNYG